MKAAMKWMAILLAAGLLAACERDEPPARFANASNEVLREQFDCDGVFDFRHLKVFVFREDGTDYKVLFFAPSGSEWVRHGAEFNLAGYDSLRQPTAEDPFVRVRHTASGQTFHFDVTPAGEVDLLPDEGSWKRIR